MIGESLKPIVPQRWWAPLREAKALFRSRILCFWYGGSDLANRVRLFRYATCPKKQLATGRIKNLLPNSGKVPLRQRFSCAQEIVANFQNSTGWPQGIEGFEGFRPVDAVFDLEKEAWELWSNARLAGFIASFAHAHYPSPSILELGCGPAHLFFFFRRYGIPDYVGMDGHPHFVSFNPLLKGSEDHFLTLNLQEELRLSLDGSGPLSFDILLSFEVLEHIREETADALLKTIRNHMHRRSVFFCTASMNQEVAVHVLVRDREWWLSRFARVGLYPRKDEGRLCRQMARAHPFNWHPRDTNLFALELRH